MRAIHHRFRVKSHHRIVPILLIVVSTPFALAVGFLLIVNVISRDEAPPDDSDLRPVVVFTPPEVNAYDDVLKLREREAESWGETGPVKDEKLEDMLRGGPWDEKYANQLLDRHQQDIALVLSAASKLRYQDPLYVDVDTLTPTSFPAPGTPRSAAKYTALEAMRQARAGNVDTALEESMAIVRLGHMIALSQGSLIDYLVAISVKQIGLTVIRQIATTTTIPVSTAKSTIAQLERYIDSRGGQVKAIQTEYAYYKTYLPASRRLDTLFSSYNLTVDLEGNPQPPPGITLMTIIDGTGAAQFYYHPNETWRYRVEATNRLIDLAGESCHETDFDAEVTPRFDVHGWRLVITPNALGKVLHDIGTISYSGLTTRRCNETLAVVATQTAVAVNAYQAADKKLPTSLEQLVPDYFPTVPVDPYSDQPLKYLPDLGHLYSVGPSRTDYGGSTPNASWQQDSNPAFIVGKR